jgi:hypothetical protein
MNSNWDITKSKDIDLDEVYNILVDDLFILNYLWSQNSEIMLEVPILKFKISNY